MKNYQQKFTIIDRETKFTVNLSEIVRPGFKIPSKQKEDGSWEIAGPCEWEPIITKIHIPENEDFKPLFDILAKIYDSNSSLPVESFYFEGILDLFDEEQKIESWHLHKLWAQSINFGYLEYSTSADLDIEISWRYSSCVYSNLTSVVSN